MSKYILPTYTGKLFDLENPTEDMICIEDIAHHLSLENRYNGATKFAYPVAYHSILGIQFAPENLKLEFLLHDAGETWYKDFPSPLKKLINNNYGLILEDIGFPVDTVLINKFKLSINPNDWYLIKEIDLRLASTEILQLVPNFPTNHWQHSYTDFPHYQGLIIREMLPSTVEQMFKEEYQKLRRI